MGNSYEKIKNNMALICLSINKKIKIYMFIQIHSKTENQNRPPPPNRKNNEE